MEQEQGATATTSAPREAALSASTERRVGKTTITGGGGRLTRPPSSEHHCEDGKKRHEKAQASDIDLSQLQQQLTGLRGVWQAASGTTLPTSRSSDKIQSSHRPTGKMKVEAASTRKSLLGEGPHWDERNSTLLMVDALGREVVRYDPSCGTESQVIRTEGDLGNVIPFADDNRQVALCMEQGLYRLNLDTHQKELLVEMLDPESPVKSRLNDGKCDALGRLWTGSMPSTGVQNVIPGKNNFWCYSKGKLQHKLDGVTLSNGITWTTDNRVMFYDDSVPGQIYAFDFDLTAGEISNRRLLADFSTTPGYEGLGVPDGMTIDLNNKIWVACFGGSAVVQIDPETAKILTKISFPAKYTTSCCFGGKNYDVLYVTTGSFRPDATRPEDGLLYRVTELGAKGKPAYEFAG